MPAIARCATCGAPIYVPTAWEGPVLPPVRRTCDCLPLTPAEKSSTSSQKPKKAPLLRLK